MKRAILLLTALFLLSVLSVSCSQTGGGSGSVSTPGSGSSSEAGASSSSDAGSGSNSGSTIGAGAESGSGSGSSDAGASSLGGSSSVHPQTVQPPASEAWEGIPFQGEQLYAIAYLGYQDTGDLDWYASKYLKMDSADLPVHRVSDGDYYLIVPRYAGMSVSMYTVDMDTDERTLTFEEKDCGPFVIQCNVSDIVPDVVLSFTLQDRTEEYTPFLSLENGSLIAGDFGLDLTKPGVIPSEEPSGGADADTASDTAADTDPYVGEYSDGISEESSMTIALGEDGRYTVWIGIYRLTSLENGVGERTDSGLEFTADDANGNPIQGVITLDGAKATVTITDSTWGYLNNGDTFDFTKM